jgi:hypothetical protein
MAQQTAVEWLATQIIIDKDIERKSDMDWICTIDVAKAMEKEQILNACYQFSDYPFNKEDHLEYYNETYKK